MSIETHRVLIGACGWKHTGWLDTFYSDDLPEEWQLGFYSNEFPVVYVPAADWLSLSDDDLAELTEDVSDGFRFILEIPAQTLLHEQTFVEAVGKSMSLGESCLGFICSLNQTICKDIQLFQDRWQKMKAIAPVCVDAKDLKLSDELELFLQQQSISEVSHGTLKSDEDLKLARGELAVSLVSSDTIDMPTLRKVIETNLAASTEECISVICFTGEPPSLEVMRNADTILNFL